MAGGERRPVWGAYPRMGYGYVTRVEAAHKRAGRFTEALNSVAYSLTDHYFLPCRRVTRADDPE